MQLVYNNSGILIDFKLRCITEANIEDTTKSSHVTRMINIVFDSKFQIESKGLHKCLSLRGPEGISSKRY